MNKLATLLCLLALGTFGLAACGGGDEAASDETTAQTTEETAASGAGAGKGGTFAIAADSGGALEFTKESATVPAGELTVEFDNPSSTPHDVVIEAENGEELVRTDVISGDQATASGSLGAGQYTFYCSVDGHRQAGMEGTLTVE